MFSYMSKNKLKISIVVLVVYTLNYFLGMLSGVWSYTTQVAYAQGWSNKKIVSVFVEKGLYENRKNDIERFARDYLWKKIDDLDAILFIYDWSFKPADLVKINQNLYLEWSKSSASDMVGTLIIWDIPLPLVNKNWFIFQTVYPLVDFVNPKFAFDPKLSLFDYQWEWDSQPEIWHSIINFWSELDKYDKYFDKIRQYADDPSSILWSGLWYDDIIDQKATFDPDNVQSYINNYIFTEDISYNRYTNLMVDVFNLLHYSGANDLFSDYATNQQNILNQLSEEQYYNSPELEEVKAKYNQNIQKFRNLIKKLKSLLGSNWSAWSDGYTSALGTLPDSRFINTLFLQATVEWFLKYYIELYWSSYYDQKEKNIQLWWRSSADDHMSKLTKVDEFTKQKIIDYNDKLEIALDDKIKKEDYDMNIIISTIIEKWECKGGGLIWPGLHPDPKKSYEVFYFGLAATDVVSAKDFGIYRGTYLNLRSIWWLQKYDINSSLDYSQNQSLGGTRWENNREVEAHRWYNFSLAEYDQQEFDRVKNLTPYNKIKNKFRTKLSTFVTYYRNGFTPLNIDSKNTLDIRLDITKMDFKNLWNPSLDRSLWWSVFDIAWSRLTTPDRVVGMSFGVDSEDDDSGNATTEDGFDTSELTSIAWYSDSFLGRFQFASAIQVARWKLFWDGKKWVKVTKPAIFKWKPRKLARINDRDFLYYDIFNTDNWTKKHITFQPSWYDQYIPINWNINYCTQKEQDDYESVSYKSISSVFEHKSPTFEEMFGKYTYLYNYNWEVQYNCPLAVQELSTGTCNGIKINVADVAWISTLGINRSDYDIYIRDNKYIISWDRIFFKNNLEFSYLNTDISLSNLDGKLTGINNNTIILYNFPLYGNEYNLGETKFKYNKTTFDCELEAQPDLSPMICKGIKFQINNRDHYINQDYYTINQTGKTIIFYKWAKVKVMNQDYDLWWLVGTIKGTTIVWSGSNLQVWWMNEMTIDRPVDSPKYVNFQWIWWDLVTFVYPDFYKVDVFKNQWGKKKLKSIPEIEEAIRSYLREKVSDYNKSLKGQYDARSWLYNKSTNFYQNFDRKENKEVWPEKNLLEVLTKHDFKVSPLVKSDTGMYPVFSGMKLRNYQYMEQDFLIDSLASMEVSSGDAISIIARDLYYQNIMRLELPDTIYNSALDVIWNIVWFNDINNKIRYIYDNYTTTYHNDIVKDKSAYKYALPEYNDKWYAVWYINSDGDDFITYDTIPPILKYIDNQKVLWSAIKLRTTNDNNQCGSIIPPSYQVALSKRPEAFKCWWENVDWWKIKLRFDSKLVDYFSSWWSDYIKQDRSTFTDNLSGERSTYNKHRWSLMKKEDPDISAAEKSELNKKLNSLSYIFDKKQISIDETLSLKINSSIDVWDINMKITSSWDNCLVRLDNSRDLCDTSSTINRNPYKKSYDISFKFRNNLSKWDGIWVTNVQFAICDRKCVYKNIQIYINPGNIDKLKFDTPFGGNDTIVAKWSKIPIFLRWYDVYDNEIWTTLYDFNITTRGQWEFLFEWSSISSITSNSFPTAFLYDTRKSSIWNETIDVKPSWFFKDLLSQLPSQSYTINIIKPIINTDISEVSIKLPDDPNYYYNTLSTEVSLDLNKLPKIKLHINDLWSKIYANISIKSVWWLVKPYIMSQWGLIQFDDIIYTWTEQVIYLIPTYIAGKDTLQVQIWDTIKNIPINIEPGNPKKTSIILDKNDIRIWDIVRSTLLVTDIRWNKVNIPTKVNFGMYGNISSHWLSWDANKIDVNNGSIDIDIVWEANGGIWYIFATIEWVNLSEQYPDYQKILVQNRAWADSGVNINYLSLFGNDWWVTQQNKNSSPSISTSIANEVISKSSKTLAVTTQLIDAKNIYDTIVAITPTGQLRNFEKKPIKLLMQDKWYYIKLDDIWNIYLWSTASNSIKPATDITTIWQDTNTIYYTPEKTDSFIYSNIVLWSQIRINDTVVFDISNSFISSDIEIRYLDNQPWWDSVWGIYYKDVLAWSMIIHTISNLSNTSTLSSINNDNYNFWSINVWWDINRISIWNKDINMYDYDKQVPSIQDSKDIDYSIWRGDYFKNVSQFSNGKSVWDSTISYSSEYMINLGDPTFTINDTSQIIPHTDFNWSLGDLTYSDPDNIIWQTIDIDFNNDGDRDIIVIYNNWKIALLSNVWGRFIKIGDLMYIEDGIKQVYVGDGDGDWYQDIFVHTNTNKLRFYKNYNWQSIDVDGYPVCLSIPDGDVWLDGLREWKLTDANSDKIVDILTNDRNNEIKIFLWWWDNVMSPWFIWANYISSDRYWCDSNWKTRQKDHIINVNSFALVLDGKDQVDNSMVHYDAIHIPPIDKSLEDVDILSNNLDTINEELEWDEGNTDIWFQLPDTGKKPNANIISTAIADGVTTTIKPDELLDNYAANLDNITYLGDKFKPSFYNGDLENIPYKSIDYINPTDTISVIKRYDDVDADVLKDGDIVKITVQISSRGYAGKMAYLEQLLWPFDVDKNFIYYTWFDRWSLPNWATLRLQNTDPYLFMVDNIDIKNNQTILFSYYVRYKSKQIVTINMWPGHISQNGDGGSIWLLPKAYAQWSDDNDLFELLPIDWCVKIKWKYTVDNIFGNLREDVEDFIGDLQDTASKTQAEFTSWLYDSLSTLSDKVSNGIIDEKWNQEWFMWFVSKAWTQLEWLGNLNVNTKLSLWISPEIDKKIDQAIQKLTKWLCDWFKLWDKNCSGVPILSSLPFNMSLLTPWDMVVMWQKIFNDKWLPTITFPGNRWPTVAWYIPAPGIFGFPFKWPTDWFGYFGMPLGIWTYSSMFRLYLSPTLTAKLGMAICIWPYGAWLRIPKLFRDVVWNCIVFAIDPGIGMCQQTNSWSSYVITPDNKKLQDFNTCNDNLSEDTKWPFKLVNKGINSVDNWLDQQYGSRPSLRIKIWGNPNITSYDSVSISDFVKKVKLPNVEPLNMEVRWPKDKWLISCIVNQFVDNQVRYIINNMTSMDINIILPDFNYIWNNIVWLKRNNQAQIEYENYYQKETSWWLNIAKSLFAKENSAKITKYLSLYTSNPFEKLQAFLNQSELIKVSTTDVVIDIPWIYKEDINKLKWTYDAWLKRNKIVIDRWEEVWRDITNSCENTANQFEKEKCNTQADNVIQFTAQLGQFERSIRQNMQVLDEYANFPTELYDLIHTYDKYLNSVNSLMYNIVSQLFGWLDKIARWFDAWVEFIISLFNILKSRQVIIDFSINRKSKCSKCTVDWYSAYSCILKGFCPKLPVFNIPPFKLPDITIDLSKIDLRTDIVLPRFKFVPKKIDIIDSLLKSALPDLPYPWDLWSLNVTIPNIPVIPAPPDLDLISLPNFIPTFEFDGPTLPPAPRLPKIAPELAMAIDIADFVWRIFCIIKNNIWLVWEKWVKSKIEQITQRTRQVEPRDSIQLLIPKAPLKSYNLFNTTSNQWWNFDINISPFADIKLSFDGIYQLFQEIADGINETTNKGIWAGDKAIKFIETSISTGRIWDTIDKANEVINSVNDYIDTSTNINIDLGSNHTNVDRFEDKLVYNDTNSVPYWQYNIVNDKIKKDLAYFITKDDDKTRLQTAKEIIRSYDYHANSSVNYDGINNIVNQVNNVIAVEKDKNQKLQEQIKLDWDWFIDDITQNYLSDDSLDLTFSTNLLNADKETIDYIKSSGNPYDTFFKTNKIVIDGIVDAMDHENYTSLGVSRADYYNQSNYLHSLKNYSDMINKWLSNIGKVTSIDSQDNSDLNQIESKQIDSSNQGWNQIDQTILSYNNLTDSIQTNTLLAQTPPGGGNVTPVAWADVVDPWLYLDGLFVKWDDGNYHNVISNRDKAKNYIDNHFQKDMNRDGKQDIVLRDDHNIYIKYASDNNPNQWWSSADLTTIYLDNTFKPNQYGYIWPWKLWSKDHAVKKRSVRWQDYDTVTYTFTNDLDDYDDSHIWYVVRYSPDIYANKNNKDNFAYIVLISNLWEGKDIRTIDMDGKKISLDNDNVKVLYIDPTKEKLDAILLNISRNRYYASVARLEYKVSVNNFIKFITFGNKDSSYFTLDKTSPWSYLQTAGMQIIADDSAPSLVLWLYRKEKNEALNLDNYKWYINTYYTLSWYRWDDSKVVKNYVVMWDKMIYSWNDGNFKIPTIFSTKPATYDILLVWEDSAGNLWRKDIRVELWLPDIKIDNVEANTIWQTDIISSLNIDLDTWVVRFINIRNSTPTILKTSIGGNTDFWLSTYQTTVTWGKFGLKNEIWFYDSDGRYLGAKIVEDGQLVVDNSSITTRVVRYDNTPKLQILKWWSLYYTIYLKPKHIDSADIKVLDGSYHISNLNSDSNAYGIFEGGRCVQKSWWECQVYINSDGIIYSPNPINSYLQWEYKYSWGKVYYDISRWSDRVFEVWFEVEPIQ